MQVEQVFLKVIGYDVIFVVGQSTFEYLHVKEHLIVISHVYKGLFEIVGLDLISFQEEERPNDEHPED